MDPENLNSAIKTGSMSDRGTRAQFLMELYDLWVTGLDICERYDKYAVCYAEKKLELTHALKLLGFYMEKDFQEGEYKKVIDLLPADATRIEDEN